MNTTNTHHLLNIIVQDPENYSGDGNVQYRTPSLEYNAGPPPSLLVTRRIPIVMMTREQLNREFRWLRDEISSDLQNLHLDVYQATAVVHAVLADILAAHPDFMPEGGDPNAV